MPDLAELGRQVKAKHPGAYDDLSDAELGKRYDAKQRQQAAGAVSNTRLPVVTPMGTLGISPASTVNALPALAGAATSEFPPAVPVAAALAAKARNALAGPMGLDSKMDPATEGIMQGIPLGLGEGAALAGPPIGRKLMQMGLGDMAKRGMAAAAAAIESRMGPGFLRQGTAKLNKLVGEQAGRVKDLLVAAKKQGMWHSVDDLSHAADDLISNPAWSQEERGGIAKLVDKEMAGLGDKIDPVALNAKLQKWSDEARNISKARKGKMIGAGHVPISRDAEGQAYDALAQKARDMLHRVDPTNPSGIPTLAEEHSKLSDMMSARDLTGRAEFKGVHALRPFAPAAGAATLGAMLPAQNWQQRALHAGAAGAALSPPGMSNAALAMSDPRTAQLLELLLRGGVAAADQTNR